MAKALVVSFSGEETRFSVSRVERSKVYGSRKRVALDAAGKPCRRASLTDDGRFMLQAGMTGQGYVTHEGKWVPNSELVGLDSDGNPVGKQPSTMDVAQIAETVPARELFDLRVSAVYALECESLGAGLNSHLAAGGVVKVPFRFRDDFVTEEAYLLKNEAGCFALVGSLSPAVWVEPAAMPPPIVPDEQGDDELDFEMF
jgi:hypothetical protein